MTTEMSPLTNIPTVEGVFIGIDPSLTCTGFAVIENGHLGTMPMKTKATGAERLHQFYQFIRTGLDIENVKLVAIEGYAFGARGHLAGLGELGGIIRLALYQSGIPFLVVPPSTLKKFATGKGTGEKGMVSKELYKRFGVDVAGNDEADAAGLALFAMHYAHGEPSTLPEANRSALAKAEYFSKQ